LAVLRALSLGIMSLETYNVLDETFSLKAGVCPHFSGDRAEVQKVSKLSRSLCASWAMLVGCLQSFSTFLCVQVLRAWSRRGSLRTESSLSFRIGVGRWHLCGSSRERLFATVVNRKFYSFFHG